MSCFRNLFSSSSPISAAEAQNKVQQLIHQNPVMVFTKSYCPYCAATKALLKKKNVKYLAIDIDLASDGSALKSALAGMTGQTSVPNIFIAQQHIGGNSELQSKNKTGELDARLAAAGAY